jgi:FkbM family methyltransferase
MRYEREDKNMLKAIKDFIKTKPRFYDFFNSLRPVTDEISLWLDKFSRTTHGQLKFIQVGASDGLRQDVLRRFILKGKWKGVLIEPLPPLFELLKANYAIASQCELSFENCVISEKAGLVDFWTCSGNFLKHRSVEDQLFWLRKSSLDREFVENSLKSVCQPDQLQEMVVCHRVSSYPLSFIVEKYFQDHRVDLVFIDAEGHDDSVIRTIDFEKCAPKAIVYETHNLGNRKEEIKAFLKEKGYTVTQLRGDAVAEHAV